MIDNNDPTRAPNRADALANPTAANAAADNARIIADASNAEPATGSNGVLNLPIVATQPGGANVSNKTKEREFRGDSISITYYSDAAANIVNAEVSSKGLNKVTRAELIARVLFETNRGSQSPVTWRPGDYDWPKEASGGVSLDDAIKVINRVIDEAKSRYDSAPSKGFNAIGIEVPRQESVNAEAYYYSSSTPNTPQLERVLSGGGILYSSVDGDRAVIVETVQVPGGDQKYKVFAAEDKWKVYDASPAALREIRGSLNNPGSPIYNFARDNNPDPFLDRRFTTKQGDRDWAQNAVDQNVSAFENKAYAANIATAMDRQLAGDNAYITNLRGQLTNAREATLNASIKKQNQVQAEIDSSTADIERRVREQQNKEVQQQFGDVRASAPSGAAIDFMQLAKNGGLFGDALQKPAGVGVGLPDLTFGGAGGGAFGRLIDQSTGPDFSNTHPLVQSTAGAVLGTLEGTGELVTDVGKLGGQALKGGYQVFGEGVKATTGISVPWLNDVRRDNQEFSDRSLEQLGEIAANPGKKLINEPVAAAQSWWGNVEKLSAEGKYFEASRQLGKPVVPTALSIVDAAGAAKGLANIGKGVLKNGAGGFGRNELLRNSANFRLTPGDGLILANGNQVRSITPPSTLFKPDVLTRSSPDSFGGYKSIPAREVRPASTKVESPQVPQTPIASVASPQSPRSTYQARGPAGPHPTEVRQQLFSNPETNSRMFPEVREDGVGVSGPNTSLDTAISSMPEGPAGSNGLPPADLYGVNSGGLPPRQTPQGGAAKDITFLQEALAQSTPIPNTGNGGPLHRTTPIFENGVEVGRYYFRSEAHPMGTPYAASTPHLNVEVQELVPDARRAYRDTNGAVVVPNNYVSRTNLHVVFGDPTRPNFPTDVGLPTRNGIEWRSQSNPAANIAEVNAARQIYDGGAPVAGIPPVTNPRAPAVRGLPDTLRLNTDGPPFPLIGGATPGRAFDPSNLPLSATSGEFTASNRLAALQDELGSNPWDDVSLDATSADDALSSARLGGRNDASSAQQKLLAPGATPKLLAPADPLKNIPDNYKGSSRVANPTATASVRGASTTPDINNVPDNYRGAEINSTDVPGVDEAGNLSTPQDTAGKVAAPQADKDKTKKVPFIDAGPMLAQATAVAYSAGIGLYPNFQKPLVSSPLNELNSYLANTSEYLSKNVNVLPNGKAAPNTVQHRPHLDLANGDVTLGAPPVLYNSLMAEAKAKGYKNANQSSFFIAPDGALTVAAIDSGGAPRTLKLVLPASDRPLSERFGVEVKNTLNPDLAFVSGTSTKQGQFGELSITAKIGAPGTPTATIGVGINANATNAKRTEINWLHIPSTNANLLQAHTKNENFRFVASQMGTFSERPGQVLATDPTAIQPRAVAGFVIENFDREKASDWMFAPGKLPKGSAQIGAGVEVAGVTGLRLDDPLTGYTGRFNVGTQYFGGVGMYKPTTQGRGPAIDIDPKLNFVTAGFQYPPDDFKVAGPLAEFVGIPIPTNGAPMFTTAPPPKPFQNVPEVPPKPRAQSEGGDLIASSAWSSEGVPDYPFVDLRADGRFTPVSFKTAEQTPPKAFVDPLSDGTSDAPSDALMMGAGPAMVAAAPRDVSGGADATKVLDELGLDFGTEVNGPVGDRVAELAADAKRWKQTGKDLTAAGGLLGNVKDPMAQAGATLLKGVGGELSSGQLTDGKDGNAATGIAGAFFDAAGKAVGGNFGGALSAAGAGLKEFGDNNVNGVNGDGAVGAISTVANIANQLGGGKDPVLGATATIASGVSESMRLGAKGAGAGEALAELRAALAAEPDKQKRIGLEAEIKDKAAEEKAYRDAQGNTTRTAIADGIGAAVGGSTGAIISKVDDVINVANRTTTDGVPDNVGFAIGGAIASAVGDATKNPTLSGLGAVSTRLSDVAGLGTGAAKYGQLAASEIAKNFSVDADGDPIPIPQSNQQIIDFAQTKEAQLRGQQSGATVDAIGLGVQTLGQVTGSKEIALAGQATSIAGNILSLDNNGIKGDAAAFGVSAGTKLLGTALGGGAGKVLAAGGSVYQAATNIAKGGFANVTSGAGSIISAVTSFLPEPVAKVGGYIGTAVAALSNPISAVPALLMEVIPGAKDLPAKLFGTYKGKMGDNAQAFNIENARIRRDNDDDFFVDELQADGTYKNVQRFDHKGYFNKASEASQVNVTDFDGDGKLDFSFKDNQYLNRAGADGAVRFVNGAEEAYAKAQTEMKTKMEAVPLVGGLYAVAGDNDGTPTWSFVDKDGFTVKGPGAITYEDQLAQGWVGVDQGGGNVVRVATADINYGTRGSKTIKVNNSAVEANVSPATAAATASVTSAATAQTPAVASAQQKQWVSDIYYQELGRGVDSEAAVNWESAFASGATNIEAMRAALRASPEGANYANTQATLAYREVLGREPDAGGLANNAALLRSGGQTVEQMRAALANSAEGLTRVAAQANAVAQANAAAQANAPVQATVAVAPAVLATVTPAGVVEAQAPEVVAEPEVAAQPQATVTPPATVEAPTYFDVPLPPQPAVTAPAMIEAQTYFDVPALAPPLQAPRLPAAQVASAYRELLNRDPDEGGLANNVALINSGAQTIEQVRANLAGSNEAKVNRAYQDFFGRGADPEGLQYWWNLMQSGQLNETQLRDSFAQIATQQNVAA
jgi:hypothetical protein